MAEFTGEVEEEYEDDVEIDFSTFTLYEKEQLMKAIENDEKFIFKKVPLCFSGEVTIDVEPMGYP